MEKTPARGTTVSALLARMDPANCGGGLRRGRRRRRTREHRAGLELPSRALASGGPDRDRDRGGGGRLGAGATGCAAPGGRGPGPAPGSPASARAGARRWRTRSPSSTSPLSRVRPLRSTRNVRRRSQASRDCSRITRSMSRRRDRRQGPLPDPAPAPPGTVPLSDDLASLAGFTPAWGLAAPSRALSMDGTLSNHTPSLSPASDPESPPPAPQFGGAGTVLDDLPSLEPPDLPAHGELQLDPGTDTPDWSEVSPTSLGGNSIELASDFPVGGARSPSAPRARGGASRRTSPGRFRQPRLHPPPSRPCPAATGRSRRLARRLRATRVARAGRSGGRRLFRIRV